VVTVPYGSQTSGSSPSQGGHGMQLLIVML